MSKLKDITNFIRTLKVTYSINNLLHYSQLKHNKALYKKYGLQKPVWSSISSTDFKELTPPFSPWLDKQSLKELAEDSTEFQSFEPSIQQSIIDWSEEGYSILQGFFEEEADQVNAEIEQLLNNGKIKFKYGNKLMFVLHQSALIYNMATHPTLTKVLSFLVGKPVNIFQSINFIKGSQQGPHSDTIHMTTYPLGYLIAVWIALEDIGPEQGPLFYYPKSHKLPYVLNDDFEHHGTNHRIGSNANQLYERHINTMVKEQKIEPKTLLAKKGDVLIWHANLLHGGMPILNPELTRKSMVFHYYAEDVICYHEITQRPALFKKG
ncbi:MAG: phytanoyl-CoA dioxygenase family protein [Aureispira sp.]|nr:phytanoyl-CoA dioxygenase family protein [Aureispira sp.]